MAFNSGKKYNDNEFSSYETVDNASESIIGNSLVIEGEVKSREPLTIQGSIIGNIKTSQTLVVEKSGKIDGDLEGKEVRICGHVKGTITSADKLEITSTGSFSGDISVKKLVIEEGATFQGQVKMITEKAPVNPEPIKQVKETAKNISK